jgi:hypothetical protein
MNIHLMNNILRYYGTAFLLVSTLLSSQAQVPEQAEPASGVVEFSLQQAIDIALKQNPSILTAR